MQIKPDEITSILKSRIEGLDTSSSVDPDILGGLVLQVGNNVLDASIRNRLENLRKQVARGAA